MFGNQNRETSTTPPSPGLSGGAVFERRGSTDAPRIQSDRLIKHRSARTSRAGAEWLRFRDSGCQTSLRPNKPGGDERYTQIVALF